MNYRKTLITTLTLLSALILPGRAVQASSDTPTPGPVTPPTTAMQKTLLVQMQDAFTQIAQAVEPTVVNIKAERPVTAGMGDGSDSAPLPAPGDKGKGPVLPRRLEATGSGVIVRSDGYILTNEHVIDQALGGMVTVTLSDGREFPGKVYPDYKSDLAIVKINPGTAKLPVAEFAGKSTVVPGQWALAVGSPFDLQNTITVGIISAVNRHQRISGDGEERYYPDLIQTDAAINPGNSGGPLFNIDGKVVGINVAIESPVEGSAGVGFAIPVTIAQTIADALISQGKVVRGYLGLTPEDLTPALETQYGHSDGAFIRDLILNSPADKAGLQAADIVTAYNGVSVHNELELREAIAASAPGQKVTIGYVRDGQAATTTATIDPAPALASDAAPTAPPLSLIPPRQRLGITARRLTAHDRQSLNLPSSTQGALVTAVSPGSIADTSGITPGIIIQKINQTVVSSSSEIAQALAAQTGSSFTLIVLKLDSTDNQPYQRALTIHL